MRLILYTSFLLLAAISASGFGPLFRGGAGGAAAPAGILLPLSGSSLVTTNSGTLTFASTQGWYGFDVLTNGSPLNVQATAICTATNGSCAVGGAQTYFKYPTGMPSLIPDTKCLVDSWQWVQTSVANAGASITNKYGDVFVWDTLASGANYNIKVTPTQSPGSPFDFGNGTVMYKAGDGNLYFQQTVTGGTAEWFVYKHIAEATAFMGILDPSAYSAGAIRVSYECPAGMP